MVTVTTARDGGRRNGGRNGRVKCDTGNTKMLVNKIRTDERKIIYYEWGKVNVGKTVIQSIKQPIHVMCQRSRLVDIIRVVPLPVRLVVAPINLHTKSQSPRIRCFFRSCIHRHTANPITDIRHRPVIRVQSLR